MSDRNRPNKSTNTNSSLDSGVLADVRQFKNMALDKIPVGAGSVGGTGGTEGAGSADATEGAGDNTIRETTIKAEKSMRANANQFKTPFVETPKPFNSKPKSNFSFNPFKFVWNFFWSIIKGFFHLLVLIKNLIFVSIFLLLLFVIIFVFIFAYKPLFLWNPLKTFMNNEIPTVNSSTENIGDIYKKINETAKNNNPVVLTESEFSKVVVDKLKLSEKSFIRLTSNQYIFYLNIDTAERPLWLVIPTEVSLQNKIRIKSIGFGRFETPEFVANILNDTVGSVFLFLENMVTSDNYIHTINEFFDQEKIDKTLTLTNVNIGSQKITLTYFYKDTTINNY